MTVVIPGPVGQYMFKYTLKPTQKQDTEEYTHVSEVTRKVLQKIQKDARVSSTAVSCVFAASFAHQKTNVVGAALSSYFNKKKDKVHIFT